MQAKVKRKMVNVQPISKDAVDTFVNKMDKLHGCYVEVETAECLSLKSINKRHFFSVSKVNDVDWKLVK